MNNKKVLKYRIFLSTSILVMIGFISIYSSSSISAFQRYGDSFFFLKKQVYSLIMAIFFFIFFARAKVQLLEKLTLPFMFVSILLLTLTLFPSFHVEVNGASRWINLGGITFQPAELAKISCILFMAKNLSRQKIQINRPFSAVVPTIGLFLVHAAILLSQPDLGTTVLIFLVISAMLFISGIDYRYFIGASILGATGFFAAIIDVPYRMARMASFVNPWQDVSNSGFQIIQSYVGFQNGGFLGLGIGESKQKLFFLPEAHTDFILAVIGEEFGFLGVSLIITSFIVLIHSGFSIARYQTRPFNRYLGFGISILITFQGFINMGVSMGILPTKGMPLPYISSGSSSFLVFAAATVILYKLISSMQYPSHRS